MSQEFRLGADGYWLIDKDPNDTLDYVLSLADWLRASDEYWRPGVEARAGEIYTPDTARLNGHRYRVDNSGRAAMNPPAWPTGSNATVADGNIVWREIGLEDTISSVAWTVPAGITQSGSPTNTTHTATITLTGGTAGATYLLSARITTTQGRITDKSFKVRVAEQ
jgi:hypothetical protein